MGCQCISIAGNQYYLPLVILPWMHHSRSGRGVTSGNFVLALSVLSLLWSLAAATPTSFATAPPGCGTLVTTSTTLAADVGPCPHNGLIIGASNVVLNCAGHSITGQGAQIGISVRQVSAKVVVENCRVSGFAVGIETHSTGGTFTGNTVTGNVNGFYLKGAQSTSLSGNTATSNTNAGILLYRADGNSLSGNTANSNGFGFYARNGSGTNTFSSNTADSNTNYGYYDPTYHRLGDVYHTDECSKNILGGSNPSGLCAPIT